MSDEQMDIHALSDEDFLSASVNDFRTDPSEELESDSEDDKEELDETPEDDVNSEDKEADEPTDEETDEEESEEKEESTDADSEESEEESETTDSEYQNQLAEIMAPIKAAGREVKLDSAAEVRKLVQMGVDYSDKMRGMKPHMKTLKMLENNGLLDPAKLSYLIDLDKKNPEAISKLLKDSELNPLDIDTTEESKYTPSDHSVSDSEVELDDVIARIQDTTTFSDTMDLVNNKWDDTSKRTLVENPTLLESLNTHMTNGTYERVMSEVNKIQMFGGLTGLSDLEAYQQVGKTMQDRGDFNTDKAKEAPTKVSSKPKVETDKDRKDKKRRASPSKKVNSSKTDKDFDPMISLSDEEFMKKFANT